MARLDDSFDDIRSRKFANSLHLFVQNLVNFESLGLGSSRQNATFYFSHLPHQKSSGKKHDWLITPNFNEFPFQVLSKNASFSIFFLCIFPAFGVTPLLPVDGCWAGAERPQQSSQQREDCGADLVTFE